MGRGQSNPSTVEGMGEQLVEKVSSKTHIPFWGIVLVLIVILAFVLMVFYCCCQRWWKKFRGDKAGKGGIGVGGKVDIRTVQLLGQTYKEKVSPYLIHQSQLQFSPYHNSSFFRC